MYIGQDSNNILSSSGRFAETLHASCRLFSIWSGLPPSLHQENSLLLLCKAETILWMGQSLLILNSQCASMKPGSQQEWASKSCHAKVPYFIQKLPVTKGTSSSLFYNDQIFFMTQSNQQKCSKMVGFFFFLKISSFERQKAVLCTICFLSSQKLLGRYFVF